MAGRVTYFSAKEASKILDVREHQLRYLSDKAGLKLGRTAKGEWRRYSVKGD